jgi:hypothetical protein
MEAVKADVALGPPVTPVVVPVVPLASEFAIQKPELPLPVVGAPIETVYVAPAAGVIVLALAVTVPETEPDPWQAVQSLALLGVA